MVNKRDLFVTVKVNDKIRIYKDSFEAVSYTHLNILSLCGPNRFLSCIDGFNDLPLPTLSGSGAPHLFLQVMCLIYNDQLDFIV